MGIKIKSGNKKDLGILNHREMGLCEDTSEVYVGNKGKNIKLSSNITDSIEDQIHAANYSIGNFWIKEDTIKKMVDAGINYIIISKRIVGTKDSISTTLDDESLINLTNMMNLIKKYNLPYCIKFHPQTDGVGNTFSEDVPSDPDAYFAAYESITFSIIDTMYSLYDNMDMVCIINESPAITRNNDFREYFVSMKTRLNEQYPKVKYSQSAIGGDFSSGLCPFLDIFDVFCENLYDGPGLNDPYFKDIACPTVDDMIKFLYSVDSKFKRTYEKYGKRIFITEFGCPPYEYAFNNPSTYNTGATKDEQVQMNYVESYIRARGTNPYVLGMALWQLYVNDPAYYITDNTMEVVKKLWGGNINE